MVDGIEFIGKKNSCTLFKNVMCIYALHLLFLKNYGFERKYNFNRSENGHQYIYMSLLNIFICLQLSCTECAVKMPTDGARMQILQ